VRDLFRLDPQPERDRGRAQNVRHVELADQPRLQRQHTLAPDQLKARRVRQILDAPRVNVRARIGHTIYIGDNFGRGVARLLLGQHRKQRLATAVVLVEDRDAGPGRGLLAAEETAKKQELGRAVCLKGTVDVQVLVRDVSQRSRIILDRRHPPLLQPETGALDHRIRTARRTHLRQERLHRRRLRRRHMQPGLLLDPGNARADRCDYAYVGRSAKNRLKQGTGRRLAVGPGNADHCLTAAGKAEKRRTQPGECLAAVLHLRVRYTG